MSVVLPTTNEIEQQHIFSMVTLRDFTINNGGFSAYAGIEKSSVITFGDQISTLYNCYSTTNVRQTGDIEIKNNISLQMSIYYFER